MSIYAPLKQIPPHIPKPRVVFEGKLTDQPKGVVKKGIMMELSWAAQEGERVRPRRRNSLGVFERGSDAWKQVKTAHDKGLPIPEYEVEKTVVKTSSRGHYEGYQEILYRLKDVEGEYQASIFEIANDADEMEGLVRVDGDAATFFPFEKQFYDGGADQPTGEVLAVEIARNRRSKSGFLFLAEVYSEPTEDIFVGLRSSGEEDVSARREIMKFLGGAVSEVPEPSDLYGKFEVERRGDACVLHAISLVGVYNDTAEELTKVDELLRCREGLTIERCRILAKAIGDSIPTEDKIADLTGDEAKAGLIALRRLFDDTLEAHQRLELVDFWGPARAIRDHKKSIEDLLKARSRDRW